MMWQDVPVQLVDLPPISPEFLEPWVPSLIRSADAALLVADLASDDVGRGGRGGPPAAGATHTELVGTLPYDVEDEAIRHVKTVLVANKADADGAADRLEVLREWFEPRFPIVPVSAQGGQGLETLREAAYHLLGVLRVLRKSLASRWIGRGRSPCPSAALFLPGYHAILNTDEKFRIWGVDFEDMSGPLELQDLHVVVNALPSSLFIRYRISAD